MISVAQNSTSPQAISVTNFDLSSLYLLRPEIMVTLDNAEKHLSEFNDDNEQAPLLLDSVAMLSQLANVLTLISLSGASDLAEVLAISMQHLYDNGNNRDEKLILSISQGVMTLSRYIEFVLLQETLEPSLLLPVINQMKTTLGQKELDQTELVAHDFTYITLANPTRNFQPLSSLDLDSSLLATGYRAGLAVALSAPTNELSESDLLKINAMHQACSIIAKESDALFWHAAEAATKDLQKLLPLDEKHKRIFIFLDQQFHNYLPADDSRFADLVSFACLQDHELAAQVKNQLNENQLDESQLIDFKRFMFGPDQEIVTTLNNLIQYEIDAIKSDVNGLVNHTSDEDSTEQLSSKLDFSSISDKLSALSSTFSLLDLSQSAETLSKSAAIVANWQHPNSEDLDQLLAHLMVAENAAITLAKSHTPGAEAWQLTNDSLSIYQLDTAYQHLMIEIRNLIKQLERSASDYLDSFDLTHVDEDVQNEAFMHDDILNNIPQVLSQIAGTLRFLEMTDAANIIRRLSSHLSASLTFDENGLLHKDEKTHIQFSKVADILLAVDHQLSARQKQHPLSKHALYVGNTSLYNLLKSA